MVCQPCGWQTIGAGENATVEAWHDQAIPGWRRLPVLPARLHRSSIDSAAAKRWIEQHYPLGARIPGAPVITGRPLTAGRKIPGRSPWAGWDLAAPPTTGIDAVARNTAPRRTIQPGRTSSARLGGPDLLDRR